jgi:hypothetical protein
MQDVTEQSDAVHSPRRRVGINIAAWGRGLIHRVDQAAEGHAQRAVVALDIDLLPSRRWLRQAADEPVATGTA